MTSPPIVVANLGRLRMSTLARAWPALLAVVSIAVSFSPALAAITATGDVSPSNPSTWTDSTLGLVGYTSAGTLTVDGGSDLLSGNCRLGYGGSATGVMNIAGSGSTWTNSGDLDVGYYGSGRLNITNGGIVNTVQTVLGYMGSGASGTVTVDGSGSALINSDSINVGIIGSATLNITNGGTVSSVGGWLGQESGSSGIVTVDGAGSTWSDSGILRIGYRGSGALNIANGGSVSNSTCYLGYSSGSSGTATVSGTSSTWINNSDLYVGYSGTGNFTQTGGTASVVGNLYLGYDSTASGTYNLNGGTLIVNYLNKGSGTATFNFGGGTLRASGDFASSLPMMLTGTGGDAHVDTAGHAVTLSGTLAGPGGLTKLGTGTLTLSGSSTFDRQTTVDGGTLRIANGGSVSNAFGLLGDSSGLSGSVTVDGAGSKWINSGAVQVGFYGSGTLNIASGGTVSSDRGYIGYNSGATGTVTVSGSGSTWTNTNGDPSLVSLTVGRSGSGTLNITGGGAVSSLNGYIGYDSGSTGTVTVSGSGSTWTNTGSDPTYAEFVVGNSGSGALSITGGGAVSSLNGNIGNNSGSTGTVTVSGTGSIWTNINGDPAYSSLRVGRSGSGTLNITNSGTVSNSKCYIGYNLGSTGMVMVSGTGSTWTNSGDLILGYGGTGSVTQTGGITSVARTLCLGNNSGSNGTYNLNGGTLVLESLEKGNGTAIFNFGGGTLQASTDFSSGLPMTLTGDGGNANVDTNGHGIMLFGVLSGTGGLNKLGSGTLYLTGNDSFAGNIDVTGGILTVSYALTGDRTVAVSGSGSVLSLAINQWLNVGTQGVGTLNVTNGGSVSTTGSYIGHNSGSTGTVTVSGATSTWINSIDLYDGYSGTGNATQTGGTVSVGNNLCLGYDSTASGTYNLNGGTLIVRDLSKGSGAATFNFGGGTLRASADFASSLPMTLTGTGGNANVDTNGHAVTLYGNLSGAGGLNKLGSGTLYLTGSDNFSGNIQVAGGILTVSYALTGDRTVTVSGSGSVLSLAIDQWLNVGTQGIGTLNVTNGGRVSTTGSFIGYNSGSTGTVTVDGAGSTWTLDTDLFVGMYGTGRLTVANGGSVSSGYCIIGYGNWLGLSSGTVTVDGAGSTWTNSGNLTIGYGYDGSCDGTLAITGGGAVINGGGNCGIGYGYLSTGVVTVDGCGSNWMDIGYLQVGQSGSGTLSVTDGGRVSNTDCDMGVSWSGTGLVNISGTGSAWTNSHDLLLGYFGTGSVMQTGGTVSVAGTLYLSKYSGSNGTYNLNGGTLILESLAAGSGTAAFNFGGGTLQASGDLCTALNMTLTGTGGNANVDTAGHGVTLSGVLSGIGGLTKSGAGTLTLSATNNYTGPTTVASGTLEVQSVAARHPVSDLGGADIQSGKMLFDYSGGTSPAAIVQGLLTASYDGGLWDVGQFRNSTAATTGLTLGWLDDQVTQTVTVMATYPGDFNLDGVVDRADMNIWFDNAGKGSTWSQGDANYDGVINGLDLDQWMVHIRLPPLAGLASDSGGSSVPEPGTLILLAAGLVGTLAYVRRRQW